jgi:hypothetical protein
MKTLGSAKLIPVEAFQIGQVWKMDGSQVEIAHVGKRLVHYKHFKGQLRRGPSLISPKAALEKLLKTRKAVLLQ